MRLTRLGSAAGALAIAFGLVSAEAAPTSYEDCLREGPGGRTTAAWTRQLPAEREATCRAWQEQREHEALRRYDRQSARPAAPAPPLTPAPPPVATPQARLSDDKRSLVVLDEVREPADRRQPGIVLGTHATTGAREIQVAGHGLRPPGEIQIVCHPPSTYRAVLASVQEQGERRIGVYAVAPGDATAIARSSACGITLAGVVVPVPRRLVQTVWDPASSR